VNFPLLTLPNFNPPSAYVTLNGLTVDYTSGEISNFDPTKQYLVIICGNCQGFPAPKVGPPRSFNMFLDVTPSALLGSELNPTLIPIVYINTDMSEVTFSYSILVGGITNMTPRFNLNELNELLPPEYFFTELSLVIHQIN
jgi:hypothetical protein